MLLLVPLIVKPSSFSPTLQLLLFLAAKFFLITPFPLSLNSLVLSTYGLQSNHFTFLSFSRIPYPPSPTCPAPLIPFPCLFPSCHLSQSRIALSICLFIHYQFLPTRPCLSFHHDNPSVQNIW